jgi:hypothetical protein
VDFDGCARGLQLAAQVMDVNRDRIRSELVVDP